MAFVNFLDNINKNCCVAKELHKHLTDKTLNNIITEINKPVNNTYFKTFEKHNINCGNNMLQGYYMNKKERTENLTMEQIIQGLYSLYTKYSSHTLYAALCVLMYNYMPMDAFLEDFAMGDFSIEWACEKYDNYDILSEIQTRYLFTREKKYLYIIILIARHRTQAFKLMKDQLELLYITPKPYTLRIKDVTIQSDISKSLSLLTKENPTILEINDILVEEAYKNIGEYIDIMDQRYFIIFLICSDHIDGLDINHVHDILIKKDIGKFEKEVLYIIHWAKLKTLARNHTMCYI